MEDLRRRIKLNFDPLSSPELSEIFQDNLGRNIYLGIRQCHIVDESFTSKCLGLVRKLRVDGAPQTVEDLQRALGLLDSHVGGYNSKEFATQLLPYVKGEKGIDYEVLKRTRA